MRLSQALILVIGVFCQGQPPAPPPGLPQAMARLQAQDPAGALAIAEQIIAREPGNARAWRVLGVAAKGTKDLIVGAWQYAGAAPSGGRAYLYSGKDGALLKTYTGKIAGETFGFDAVGVGDIDGDGTIDLLITSAWSGIKGFHSGRMFIISSGVR
jgi:hypothetical protein